MEEVTNGYHSNIFETFSVRSVGLIAILRSKKKKKNKWILDPLVGFFPTSKGLHFITIETFGDLCRKTRTDGIPSRKKKPTSKGLQFITIETFGDLYRKTRTELEKGSF